MLLGKVLQDLMEKDANRAANLSPVVCREYFFLHFAIHNSLLCLGASLKLAPSSSQVPSLCQRDYFVCVVR